MAAGLTACALLKEVLWSVGSCVCAGLQGAIF